MTSFPLRGLSSLFLLVLIVCLASCGGSQSTGAGGAGEEAKDRNLVEEATLSGIRSGFFEGRFTLDNETAEEAMQWRASTPFVGLDKQNGPELNTRYEVSGIYGGKVNEEAGRLLVRPRQALLTTEGTSYGVDGPLFGLEDAGCEKALRAIHVGDLIDNLSSRPIPTSEAILVEAKLDLPALLAAFDAVRKSSACGALLSQAGVSPAALEALEADVEDNFEKSEARFQIRQDHVLQNVALGIWVRSPSPGSEEVDGRMEVAVTRPNEVKKAIGGAAAQDMKSPDSELGDEQRKSLRAGATLVRTLLDALGAE